MTILWFFILCIPLYSRFILIDFYVDKQVMLLLYVWLSFCATTSNCALSYYIFVWLTHGKEYTLHSLPSFLTHFFHTPHSPHTSHYRIGSILYFTVDWRPQKWLAFIYWGIELLQDSTCIVDAQWNNCAQTQFSCVWLPEKPKHFNVLLQNASNAAR